METIEIHWEITNKCNLQCSHCLVAYSKETNELTFEQAKKAVLKMKEANVSTICFTGGEPFCFENFIELLEFVILTGIIPKIVTNGSFINKTILSFLKNNNIDIAISLDGINRETNDQIRGDGTFQKVMNILNESIMIDYQVSLYFTLNKFNINNIEDIILLSKQYNCKNIHINDLTIEGRIKSNTSLIPNNEMKKMFINNLKMESQRILGKDIQGPLTECWADNTTLLLASNGDIYHCTEIKRVDRNNYIGNINTFSLKRWIEDNQFLDYSNKNCCYHVYYNDYISYISNSSEICFMNKNEGVINNLEDLYKAFDKINNNYNLSCCNCDYPDCIGYIWLLKEEANNLYEYNISIVEINDDVNLINSFDTDKGIDITKYQPKCIHKTPMNKCYIYEKRPLVCHMYPVGPETFKNDNLWILHIDCKFYVEMKNRLNLSDYICDIKKIIARISKELYKEIEDIYNKINYISKYPDGENKYIIIREM
jgi:MoaA/NifB/PqqE/SkfB family radical SAM enzyme/Fe-S-cluster containining protein